MNLLVSRTAALSGSVTPPSSKSQNIRGLFFALLAKGQSQLYNVLESDDMKDAVRVCQSLGATIQLQQNEIIIDSPGLPLTRIAENIFSGNSGITTRFSLPILGFKENNQQEIYFDCGEQMRARPISTLAQALQNLGMNIRYLEKQGSCPLAVSGQLRGGKTSVNGLSSQYLSALLISLPCAQENSEITVEDLHERPYVEMTLSWLKEQKIRFSHQIIGNQDIFDISGGQIYRPFQKNLTGDFSSASYLLAAGVLLGTPITLLGLDMNDPQGDKKLVEILQKMGADILIDSDKIIVHATKKLTGIRIDANDIPDLLPTLAVIATQASGKTEILNVPQARIKETDRIHSMAQGLQKLGAKVEEHPDGLTIYQSQLQANTVKGFGDHRTVMALSIAGLLAEGITCIDDAQAIDKTFPDFVAMMKKLGGNMELRNVK